MLGRAGVPQEGHMLAALNIMSYLRGKHNACHMFDPNYPTVNEKQFNVPQKNMRRAARLNADSETYTAEI